MSSTRHILFLDFDGVLHPSFCDPEHLFCRLPDLSACLLAASKPCEIVITSNRRFDCSVDGLRALFPCNLRTRIIGTTGRQVIGSYARLNEIQAFLSLLDGFVDWKALDDSASGFPAHCENLLLCNPETGVTSKELKLLRAWLERTE